MKSLRYEEVNMSEYEDMAEARERTGHSLGEFYNGKPLHSGLGQMTTVEFEHSLLLA